MRRGQAPAIPDEFRGLVPEELLRQFGGPDLNGDDQYLVPDEDLSERNRERHVLKRLE